MLRRLASDSVWNVVGQAIPAAVALLVIPPLLTVLGDARFGFLSLALAIIGFFGLFDLGLSRSLTHEVAKAHASDPSLVWQTVRVGTKLLGILGAVTALLLIAVYVCLPTTLMPVHDITKRELDASVALIALAVPMVTLTQGLRGSIEGLGLFRVSNLLRIPQGILTFAGPLVGARLTGDLIGAMTGLLFSRFAGALMFSWGALRELRALPRDTPHDGVARRLLSYGGWLSVSNLLSPLMTTFDRFLIAARASLIAVSVYAVSFDLLTKLLMVPAAISNAAFPKLCAARRHPESIRELMEQSVALTLAVCLPLCAFFALFGQEVIDVWIDANMAARTHTLIGILIVGVFINALAHLPFSLIQAVGRPDLTARAHILEAAPYLALLVLLLESHGVEGAAFAWAARAALDLVLLLHFCARSGFPVGAKSVLRILLSILMMIFIVGVGQLQTPILFRIFVLLAVSGLMALPTALILRRLHQPT